MKKFLFTASATLGLFTSSLAQNTSIGQPIVDSLGQVSKIMNILQPLLLVAAFLAFATLIVIFIWRKMKGSDKADNTSIVWGLVALTALFCVWGLVRLLGSVVGVSDTQNTINRPILPL